ncbi:MAG: lipocalin family protein [Spirochaetes bacterium]|nr:lipocalin family protein [Spirochaetota bacterium]
MKIYNYFYLMILISQFISGCTGGDMKSDLPVVDYVDLNRYIGKWYEIARYPNRFQKDCVATTATYSIREDGDIKVLNQCRKVTVDGELDTAEGKAWVVDKKTNAKLKVQFFWPFRGDYWIIMLDKNYKYSIVSDPDRKFLWILSRTPQMEQGTYNKIIKKLKSLGFDEKKLIKAPQNI